MIDDPHLQDMLSGSPEHRPGQSEASDAVAMKVEAELAEAMGSLNLVSARLVRLVARTIEEDLWDQGGVRSPTHYVCWQTGLAPARAQQVLRLAVGLGRLPVTRAAFEAGELTADQADIVVRWTPPDHDARACELARQLTVPQLRRAMPALSPPDPAPTKEEADGHLAFGANDRGDRWRFGGWLPIDAGQTAEAALRAARDRGESWAEALIKIFETALDDADRPQPSDGDGHSDGPVRGGDDHNIPSPAGTAAGDDGGNGQPVGTEDRGGDNRHASQADQPTGDEVDPAPPPSNTTLCLPGLDDGDRDNDGPCPTCGVVPGAGPAPARQRHRIWFHLETDPRGDPVLSAHPDIPLPQAIARDLLCDNLLSTVTPFGVGRSQRIVPERTRRKVEHRDKGCRYPGCDLIRVQVHHIIHWLDHGETETPNLVSLCARHHRLHHLGAYEIAGDADSLTGLVFSKANGQRIEPRPPPKPPPGGYADCERSATWAHPTGERLDTHWITPPTAGRHPPPRGDGDGEIARGDDQPGEAA